MSSSVPAITEYGGDGDSSDDETWLPVLDGLADFQLSIESAKLSIDPTTGGADRRVYGDIHIGGCTFGKAFTVYHRTADQAETAPPGSVTDLTLCGPRYSIYGKEPEFLYVDLHQVPGAPLLRTRVAFDRTLANPNRPWAMVAVGEGCSVTVHMTVFTPSVMTRISVSPSHDDRAVLVSGTITAVQATLDGGEIRRAVPLLRRPASDPIRLGGGDAHITIPLDRNVVVCPIEIDRDIAQQLYDDALAAGIPPFHTPDDPVRGKGSSLVIDVDLQVWIDQGSNARLLAEKGLAVEIERGEDGSFNSNTLSGSMPEDIFSLPSILI